MNTFCPFLKDQCRPDCVFRIREISADSETLTVCRLVSTAATNFDLCDKIIREKEKKSDICVQKTLSKVR